MNIEKSREVSDLVREHSELKSAALIRENYGGDYRDHFSTLSDRIIRLAELKTRMPYSYFKLHDIIKRHFEQMTEEIEAIAREIEDKLKNEY